MVELIQYEPSHFSLIQFRPEFAKLDGLESRLAARVRSDNSHIRTVLIDGQPSAVVGISFIWSGCAEAWAITSDNFCHRPVAVVRALKRGIDQMIRDLHIHRLQANVVQGHARNQRFACMLGFKPEAVLRHYGPDKANHILFRKVIE